MECSVRASVSSGMEGADSIQGGELRARRVGSLPDSRAHDMVCIAKAIGVPFQTESVSLGAISSAI